MQTNNTLHAVLLDARKRADRDLNLACADMRDTPRGDDNTAERVLWDLAGAAMDLANDVYDIAQDAVTEFERGERNAALRNRHAHTLRGESYAACGHGSH